MRDRTIEFAQCLLLAVALGATASGAPAIAQTVQKCIAADGHVTLTSDACAAGHRLAGTYDAVPEQVATATPAKVSSDRTLSGSRTRRAGGASGSRARGTPATRCQAAHDRREQTLRRAGLKRTFDLLRKLDDEVWAACG